MLRRSWEVAEPLITCLLLITFVASRSRVLRSEGTCRFTDARGEDCGSEALSARLCDRIPCLVDGDSLELVMEPDKTEGAPAGALVSVRPRQDTDALEIGRLLDELMA